MPSVSILLTPVDRVAIGTACQYAAGRRLRQLLACDWDAAGNVEATVQDWQLPLLFDEVDARDEHPGCIPEALRERLLNLGQKEGG